MFQAINTTYTKYIILSALPYQGSIETPWKNGVIIMYNYDNNFIKHKLFTRDTIMILHILTLISLYLCIFQSKQLQRKDKNNLSRIERNPIFGFKSDNI